MSDAFVPNRWLHLRHAEGFSDDLFCRFEAGCRLWLSFARTCIDERRRLGEVLGEVDYRAGSPALSADRRVATLPVGGPWTLGSRSAFEDGSAWLLSHFMTHPDTLHIEQGLTEDIGQGPATSWRPVVLPIHLAVRQGAKSEA